MKKNNPLLFEHLTLIIDSYEEKALEVGSREAYLAIAQSPLAAMQSIVESSEETLNSVTRTRESSTSLVELDLDLDIQELFGDSSNPVASYLQECFGCDFRLKFDWQLKPLNLLGNIGSILDSLDVAISGFSFQLDPKAKLQNVCEVLNMLKGLCLPDVIVVLLSVKMLLKKYTSNAFNFKIDWTVIVGPMLKAIVEGVASLLENIASVILAPLDCSIAAMTASRELVGVSQSLSNLNAFMAQTSIEVVPEHLRITASTRLEEVINHPQFPAISMIDKMLLTTTEAKRYIQDLLNQILGGLRNTGSLVSGGISLQLGNIGIILFLQDLISLVMAIIDMLKSNRNINDWCSVLEENPEILQNALRNRFDDAIRVESGLNGLLNLYNGPDFIGEIRTCNSSKSESDKKLIQSWIQELETKGI